MKKLNRLKRNFFNRPTVQVAQDLLGKIIVFGSHMGYITETEAYIGEGDPACHAAKGLTPRTKVLFGPPGFSYVYFIYGMYYCLNFVTEPEGKAAAVLIRGLKLLEDPYIHLNGPGKLCKYLCITKEQNNLDITCEKNFYVADNEIYSDFVTTPRIGIKVGTDLPWRFVLDPSKLMINQDNYKPNR